MLFLFNQRLVLFISVAGTVAVAKLCWKTYKPRKTNPIRMHLSTRRTLDLESIVIGFLFCILRTEVGDSMAL